jgi:membrane-bound metal-dependent hydrolase YbcI (DUF457 family)
MFIGHYALAFAAKRAAPATSLGTLFVAPTLADLLWPLLVLAGWEQAHVEPGPNPFLTLWLDDFPMSHSLIALIAWGALFGFLYKTRTGYRRGAVVLGLLVVSHWALDFITHRPDMPFYPGSAEVGLGLWRSPAATVIVESVMLIAGVAIYARVTRPRDGIGRWAFWGLVALLAGGYLSSVFTPSPTDMRALAIGGLVFEGVFVLLAWWVDRHREAELGQVV